MDLSAKNEKDLSKGRPVELGRNFLWMAWSGVISIANSVLVWVFMARMRDVEDVGRFTIVLGLYALFFGIVSLGLMPYLVNEMSRRNSSTEATQPSVHEFVSSASVFLMISAVSSAALMTACGFLVSESWTVRVSTMVLSVALIPTVLITVSEAAAISYGRARLVAAVTTIENVLRTVVPIALIWAGFGLPAVCMSFAAVRFVALTAYLIAGRKYVAMFSFSLSQFRRIASVCPTFAGTIFFASINWQAPLILLGFLSTETESAKFGVASRFLIPVTILMASYASVIQPELARHKQKRPAEFTSYLSRMARWPLIAAALASLGSLLFSRPVLAGVFGENYSAAAPTLDILTFSTIPFCIVIVVARGLVATGRQHIDLLANILGVGVCVGLGAVFIPRYGAVGAAAAQLISLISMAAFEIGGLKQKVTGFRVWPAFSPARRGSQ